MENEVAIAEVALIGVGQRRICRVVPQAAGVRRASPQIAVVEPPWLRV